MYAAGRNWTLKPALEHMWSRTNRTDSELNAPNAASQFMAMFVPQLLLVLSSGTLSDEGKLRHKEELHKENLNI